MMNESPIRQNGVQEVDIISMVKKITKYAVTVKKSEDIKLILEQAFYHALTGRAGPVWIDIPLDIQGAPIKPDSLKSWQRAKKGSTYTVKNSYINSLCFNCSRVFYYY